MAKIIHTKYTGTWRSSVTGFTIFTDYIRVYILIDDFVKLNPPCQTCLIQSMCVTEKLAHPTLDSLPDHLQIKICERLEKFVKNNKFFTRY